jgi:neutral trehalase
MMDERIDGWFPRQDGFGWVDGWIAGWMDLDGWMIVM